MNHINFKELLTKVKAFAFDVDGVLSNNILLHPSGDMMRFMNIKDGFAINYAIKAGYPIAIITGAASDSIYERFSKIGVTDIYLKSHNKIVDFNTFLSNHNLKPEEILYMGDDLPDHPVMKVVGVPTCPADAVDEIKGVAVYVSHKSGGEGCARDVIEQTLRVQGKWVNLETHQW